MWPPDLEDLLSRVPFHQPSAARARLGELFGDTTEMLALVPIAGRLGDSLRSCADADAALTNLQRFVHARGSRLQFYRLLEEHPAALALLVHVAAASQYLADVLVRNPEYFDLLVDSDVLGTSRSAGDLKRELASTCAAFHTRGGKLDAVRRFRRREILRIGAADLRGLSDLRQTTGQLSDLADAVVEQCLDSVSDPPGGAGLFVLAMGKLGGGELNYSSDIDLIFVTAEANQSVAAIRQAQALTGALSEPSGEGFLYRVDVRLRPYGGSGALVVSSEMFEEYLQDKAHPAERQAMLKARVIAGAVERGRAFLERITPIVFAGAGAVRRHVRSLKDRIERQLKSRRQSDGHVKLAPGGIRDIEFVVQALQLETAEKRPELRCGNTLDAIGQLAGAGVLAAADARELGEAYVFLRTVEHRLQLMDNQQVHQLPKSDDELRVLARTLGFSGLDEGSQLRAAYHANVGRVRAIFERILPP